MYPSLFRRVVATLADLAVVFGAGSWIIQRPLLPEPEIANLWLALGFALIYEPVLTAYACTFGQAMMRTRVRRFESLERITLGQSYLRFLMKYVASIFGAASSGGRVRVWPRQDLRALHDQTADTVVVNVEATER